MCVSSSWAGGMGSDMGVSGLVFALGMVVGAGREEDVVVLAAGWAGSVPVMEVSELAVAVVGGVLLEPPGTEVMLVGQRPGMRVPREAEVVVADTGMLVPDCF